VQTYTAPALLLAILAASAGCHPTPALTPSSLPVELAEVKSSDYFSSRLHRTGLSFSFSPMSVREEEITVAQPRVRPIPTRWGDPWDRAALARRLNDILIGSGVVQRQQRVRMIAHAIVASGWRQNVWNHNLWGVRRGSWEGPYFVMSTMEEDDEGNQHLVYEAEWRSFPSWEEAVADFNGRIAPDSKRPSYRQAYHHLVDPSWRADARYWEALGDGNYYTATHFSRKSFAMLCWAIRGYLEPV